jgi:hypothetical protein
MQQVGHNWRRAVALMAVGLTLAACGDDAGPSGSATSAPANTARPEGSWTMVRWLDRRSDTSADRGRAVERRLALTPSCPTGPCDVAVKPGGVGGTYLPEGYTASANARPPTPYTLSWQEASGTYEFAEGPVKVSCTTADGRSVPDGYEVTSTLSLTFTPGPPAALRGTYTEKVKGIGAGIAAKCTDHEAFWTVAAAPTVTALDQEVDLAGTYVVTEVVEAVVPAGSRPPGFAGILVPSAKVAKAESGFTITGTGATSAMLSAGATGWGGEASSSAACEPGGRTVADGFSQTERWSALLPVVSTEAGRPVLVGRWESQWTPTAAGASAGCTASSNKGYVLLVPTG